MRASSRAAPVLVGAVAWCTLAAPAFAEPSEHRAAAEASVAAARTLEHAERLHRRAELLSRRLLRALDAARRTGERARARCVDDALARVHSALRRIERRLGEVRGAAEASDPRRLRHGARVLAVLDTHLRRLDRRGRRCLGGPAAQTDLPPGATRVEVHIAPGTPREDPTRLRSPWGWWLLPGR